MRIVDFTHRLQLNFNGQILSDAIVTGDIDGDGGYELIVGTSEGEMLIFKGCGADGLWAGIESQIILEEDYCKVETKISWQDVVRMEECAKKPWIVAKSLGTISSIAIGDVLNNKKQMIVVISYEGKMHLFEYPFGIQELLKNDNKEVPRESSSISQMNKEPNHKKSGYSKLFGSDEAVSYPKTLSFRQKKNTTDITMIKPKYEYFNLISERLKNKRLRARLLRLSQTYHGLKRRCLRFYKHQNLKVSDYGPISKKHTLDAHLNKHKTLIFWEPLEVHSPSSTLKIPVNSDRVIISDIDGDGKNEIVISTSDGTAYSFKIELGKKGLSSKFISEKSISKSSVNRHIPAFTNLYNGSGAIQKNTDQPQGSFLTNSLENGNDVIHSGVDSEYSDIRRSDFNKFQTLQSPDPNPGFSCFSKLEDRQLKSKGVANSKKPSRKSLSISSIMELTSFGGYSERSIATESKINVSNKRYNKPDNKKATDFNFEVFSTFDSKKLSTARTPTNPKDHNYSLSKIQALSSLNNLKKSELNSKDKLSLYKSQVSEELVDGRDPELKKENSGLFTFLGSSNLLGWAATAPNSISNSINASTAQSRRSSVSDENTIESTTNNTNYRCRSKDISSDLKETDFTLKTRKSFKNNELSPSGSFYKILGKNSNKEHSISDLFYQKGAELLENNPKMPHEKKNINYSDSYRHNTTDDATSSLFGLQKIEENTNTNSLAYKLKKNINFKGSIDKGHNILKIKENYNVLNKPYETKNSSSKTTKPRKANSATMYIKKKPSYLKLSSVKSVLKKSSFDSLIEKLDGLQDEIFSKGRKNSANDKKFKPRGLNPKKEKVQIQLKHLNSWDTKGFICSLTVVSGVVDGSKLDSNDLITTKEKLGARNSIFESSGSLTSLNNARFLVLSTTGGKLIPIDCRGFVLDTIDLLRISSVRKDEKEPLSYTRIKHGSLEKKGVSKEYLGSGLTKKRPNISKTLLKGTESMNAPDETSKLKIPNVLNSSKGGFLSGMDFNGGSENLSHNITRKQNDSSNPLFVYSDKKQVEINSRAGLYRQNTQYTEEHSGTSLVENFKPGRFSEDFSWSKINDPGFVSTSLPKERFFPKLQSAGTTLSLKNVEASTQIIKGPNELNLESTVLDGNSGLTTYNQRTPKPGYFYEEPDYNKQEDSQFLDVIKGVQSSENTRRVKRFNSERLDSQTDLISIYRTKSNHGSIKTENVVSSLKAALKSSKTTFEHPFEGSIYPFRQNLSDKDTPKTENGKINKDVSTLHLKGVYNGVFEKSAVSQNPKKGATLEKILHTLNPKFRKTKSNKLGDALGWETLSSSVPISRTNTEIQNTTRLCNKSDFNEYRSPMESTFTKLMQPNSQLNQNDGNSSFNSDNKLKIGFGDQDRVSKITESDLAGDLSLYPTLNTNKDKKSGFENKYSESMVGSIHETRRFSPHISAEKPEDKFSYSSYASHVPTYTVYIEKINQNIKPIGLTSFKESLFVDSKYKDFLSPISNEDFVSDHPKKIPDASRRRDLAVDGWLFSLTLDGILFGYNYSNKNTFRMKIDARDMLVGLCKIKIPKESPLNRLDQTVLHNLYQSSVASYNTHPKGNIYSVSSNNSKVQDFEDEFLVTSTWYGDTYFINLYHLLTLVAEYVLAEQRKRSEKKLRNVCVIPDTNDPMHVNQDINCNIGKSKDSNLLGSEKDFNIEDQAPISVMIPGRIAIEFEISEVISGFSSGYYTPIIGENPAPCLIYTDLKGRLWIYYRLEGISELHQTYGSRIEDKAFCSKQKENPLGKRSTLNQSPDFFNKKWSILHTLLKRRNEKPWIESDNCFRINSDFSKIFFSKLILINTNRMHIDSQNGKDKFLLTEQRSSEHSVNNNTYEKSDKKFPFFWYNSLGTMNGDISNISMYDLKDALLSCDKGHLYTSRIFSHKLGMLIKVRDYIDINSDEVSSDLNKNGYNISTLSKAKRSLFFLKYNDKQYYYSGREMFFFFESLSKNFSFNEVLTDEDMKYLDSLDDIPSEEDTPCADSTGEKRDEIIPTKHLRSQLEESEVPCATLDYDIGASNILVPDVYKISDTQEYVKDMIIPDFGAMNLLEFISPDLLGTELGSNIWDKLGIEPSSVTEGTEMATIKTLPELINSLLYKYD
ncbi:hypothetical protein BB560_004551 [Smittium megazygosporum]|uniref:Uncharacterized protein n=1 Tax=Smittium megazygosporum TaxID=133381 RepID=A0A2T9Z8X1_9FUNG|nr:hypothetical protein BB560_004551 [Smittium megazygosporum]